ncbi:hypothetical protein BpHYR1_041712 [Brachionus plicatilis]|uniref:Uncharacterized protein n=1 Tax=Brachionus plicatilis TaxID=10195 RepID=A0A3M7PX35_BRAPC|nr:hypothetical protein BpHYR1_041712 [Brachionus plicatilis]
MKSAKENFEAFIVRSSKRFVTCAKITINLLEEKASTRFVVVDLIFITGEDFKYQEFLSTRLIKCPTHQYLFEKYGVKKKNWLLIISSNSNLPLIGVVTLVIAKTIVFSAKFYNSVFENFVLSVQIRDLGVVFKYRFLAKDNQKISQKKN